MAHATRLETQAVQDPGGKAEANGAGQEIRKPLQVCLNVYQPSLETRKVETPAFHFPTRLFRM